MKVATVRIQRRWWVYALILLPLSGLAARSSAVVPIEASGRLNMAWECSEGSTEESATPRYTLVEDSGLHLLVTLDEVTRAKLVRTPTLLGHKLRIRGWLQP